MKQNVFCIYRDSESLPYKIIGYTPFPTDLAEGDRVCSFLIEGGRPPVPHKNSDSVDVTFDEMKEYFPAGSLFCIYEVNELVSELVDEFVGALVGSPQGYSHKKACSIVKNLLIAYPNKTYKLKRIFKDKTKKCLDSSEIGTESEGASSTNNASTKN